MQLSHENNIEVEPGDGHGEVWKKPTGNVPDFGIDKSRRFVPSIVKSGLHFCSLVDDFHTLEGGLDEDCYTGILEERLLPFTYQIFHAGSYLLQQYKAPWHAVRTVRNI